MDTKYDNRIMMHKLNVKALETLRNQKIEFSSHQINITSFEITEYDSYCDILIKLAILGADFEIKQVCCENKPIKLWFMFGKDRTLFHFWQSNETTSCLPEFSNLLSFQKDILLNMLAVEPIEYVESTESVELENYYDKISFILLCVLRNSIGLTL